MNFLLRAAQDFDVQIYSSRSKEPDGVEAMKMWFAVWDETLAQSVRGLIEDNVIKFPTEKPAAFLTLDDRCICFAGQWPSMTDMLSFKPWNKK
jgi:hypothetical protein